jgi:hypothetical protein
MAKPLPCTSEHQVTNIFSSAVGRAGHRVNRLSVGAAQGKAHTQLGAVAAITNKPVGTPSGVASNKSHATFVISCSTRLFYTARKRQVMITRHVTAPV